MSVFGNAVAGISPGLAATPQRLLGLPTEGCEPIAFSLLMTSLELRQWELRQQSPTVSPRELYQSVDVMYQALLTYQDQSGGFKLFRYEWFGIY